jgi:AraC-like DNA-binding protein
VREIFRAPRDFWRGPFSSEKSMPGGGTRTFADAALYEAALCQAQIQAAIVFRGKFSARITWAELQYLQLLRCEEDAARTGYLRLAPDLAFITFAAYPTPLPVWRGCELHRDQIILHRRGEWLHQCVPRSFVWNVIGVERNHLWRYSQALSVSPGSLSPEGAILQSSPRLAARLRRLHAQACRLAETKSKMLSHPQVSRAIEHELMEALVLYLTTATPRAKGLPTPQHTAIMDRFEEILAKHPCKRQNILELCELVGVSARTLRSCCARFLGMSPMQYILLRRLREVRNALLRADADAITLAQIAERFGFAKAAHLGRAYRATFGEAPSATLQCALGGRSSGR